MAWPKEKSRGVALATALMFCGCGSEPVKPSPTVGSVESLEVDGTAVAGADAAPTDVESGETVSVRGRFGYPAVVLDGSSPVLDDLAEAAGNGVDVRLPFVAHFGAKRILEDGGLEAAVILESQSENPELGETAGRARFVVTDGKAAPGRISVDTAFKAPAAAGDYLVEMFAYHLPVGDIPPPPAPAGGGADGVLYPFAVFRIRVVE